MVNLENDQTNKKVRSFKAQVNSTIQSVIRGMIVNMNLLGQKKMRWY